MRFFKIGLGVLAIAGIMACNRSKPCSPTTAAEDDTRMKAYIGGNGVNATLHSSGLYYQILEEGTGAYPTANSTVSAKYTGRLVDGTVFDSADSIPFPLYRVIPGWQIGIPLVKTGGTIKLIIPPYLAYGCDPVKNNGVTVIPGNSVLIFDVKVLKTN